MDLKCDCPRGSLSKYPIVHSRICGDCDCRALPFLETHRPIENLMEAKDHSPEKYSYENKITVYTCMDFN